MKQLMFILVLMLSFHVIGMAQDSKVKTKVDGSEYKKKVETEGIQHTAMYSPSSHRGHVVHHYARHRPTHRHITYRRHVYHRHVIHHKRHIHRRPSIHYKKVKRDYKKGEYKAKA
jgi:hypothetical protein